MEEIKRGQQNFIAYEYKDVEAEENLVSMYLDCYKNFGWILDENRKNGKEIGKVVLHLKRDRKIVNKAELTRLQRNFEDCMRQIKALERSKESVAQSVSIGMGVVGTAFLAGAVFAVVAETPIIWLAVLLGIPGILGWIFPCICYKKIRQRREKEVQPFIEDKYDEIYEICEKGSKLMEL